MHSDFDDALRAAAHLVAEADRKTRGELPTLKGQEESYSPTFITRVKDGLNNIQQDGIHWHVVTYTPTKSEEADFGADLIVGINLKLGAADAVTKGFLAQAKINHNTERGLRVDNRAKLLTQCGLMTNISQSSWVFAYGEQGTKILRAQNIQAADGMTLSKLRTKSVFDFFYDVFQCDIGDFNISAAHATDLRQFAKTHSARSAMFVSGQSSEGEEGDIVPRIIPSPRPRTIRRAPTKRRQSSKG